MFNFITTKLLLWVCAGLVAALVVTGSFAGCEHHNAQAARADRDAMKSQRDTARRDRAEVIKANESQQETIDAQSKALDEWLKIGVTPEEVEDLVAGVRAKKAELEQLVAENQKRKEMDNANPDCDRLRQVDFESVCRNRARVLRGYEHRLSGQTGPGPDASVRGTPSGAARAALPAVSLSGGPDAGRSP